MEIIEVEIAYDEEDRPHVRRSDVPPWKRWLWKVGGLWQDKETGWIRLPDLSIRHQYQVDGMGNEFGRAMWFRFVQLDAKKGEFLYYNGMH